MGDADPAAPYNFASIHHVDAAPTRSRPRRLAPALARGEGYLGFTRNGWQETLGVHMTSGAPDQLIVLPKSTYLPLWSRWRDGAAVLAFLFKGLYGALLVAAVVVGASSCGARRAPGSRATTGRCRSAVA